MSGSNEPLDPNDEVESLPATGSISFRAFLKDLTYREIHLFVVGVFYGLSGRKLNQKLTVQGKVAPDSWYAMGGFVIGRILMLVVAVVVAVTGLMPLLV
jgi:hypothetical protein